jgi:hypothetical protein
MPKPLHSQLESGLAGGRLLKSFYLFTKDSAATADLDTIRALPVEIHADWIEAHRYLNMETLRELRKQLHLLQVA